MERTGVDGESTVMITVAKVWGQVRLEVSRHALAVNGKVCCLVAWATSRKESRCSSAAQFVIREAPNACQR